MLVLRRRDGQWIEIESAATGHVLRVRVYRRPGDRPEWVNMAFDDADHHFLIRRPERVNAPPAPPSGNDA